MLFFNVNKKNKLSDKIDLKSKYLTNEICASISELNIVKDIIELKSKELITTIGYNNNKNSIEKILSYYNKEMKSYIENLIDSECYVGDIFFENRKWYIEIKTDSKSLKQLRIW